MFPCGYKATLNSNIAYHVLFYNFINLLKKILKIL